LREHVASVDPVELVRELLLANAEPHLEELITGCSAGEAHLT
jgi:hypothetical protein